MVIVTGVAGVRAAKSAAVNTVSPTFTDTKPSGASTVKVSPIRVAFSATLLSPDASPFVSGMTTVGSPSVTPVTVMVTVVAEVSPSLSLIT